MDDEEKSRGNESGTSEHTKSNHHTRILELQITNVSVFDS